MQELVTKSGASDKLPLISNAGGDSNGVPVSMDFDFAASRGDIPGASSYTIYGSVVASGATAVDVWSYGGDKFYESTAKQIYISSTDNSDQEVVTVLGLDSSWNLIQASAQTSGWDQVAVSGTNGGSMIRVIDNWIPGAATPAGDIYIAVSGAVSSGVPSSGADIRDKMVQGDNESTSAVFSIPAGKKGWLAHVSGGTSDSQYARVSVLLRENGKAFRLKTRINLGRRGELPSNFHPIPLPEKSDLKFRVTSNSAGSFVDLTATVIVTEN